MPQRSVEDPLLRSIDLPSPGSLTDQRSFAWTLPVFTPAFHNSPHPRTRIMVLRIRKREISSAAALLLLVIITIKTLLFHPRTSSWKLRRKNAPVTGGHPYVKPLPLPWAPPFPTITIANWDATRTRQPVLEDDNVDGPDRVLVVAKLEGEDTSWVRSSFPYWKIAEYTIPAVFSQLYQQGNTVDEGRIANAYLTYLIENYYNLPSTIVFLTPHRNTATEFKERSNFISLGRYPDLQTLNITYIQKAGYTNLRCATPAVCLTPIVPFRSPPGDYRGLEVAMPEAWKELFPNTPVPEKLATSCCAEFAVSREQLRKRGLDEYQRFWEWLNRTELDDDTAGLVMGALWHVVFGRPAVDCEEGGDGVGRCECNIYGRC